MKISRFTSVMLVIAAVSAMNCPLFADYPTPAGLWQFNDASNLTKSTLGANLIESGTHTAVAGITAGDGAVNDPLTSYYRCNHGIAANGGGVYVNEWTVLFDVNVPTASLGQWVCLYQTNVDNSNDGDCFIAYDETIGVSATGYTSSSISGETWYRIVISVDNSSFYRIYVNGSLWKEGISQPLDGRFALDPQILFFADENGDDYPIICTNIAIWGQALTTAQIAELAGPTTAITFNDAGTNQLENSSGDSLLAGWTVADGNDWQATDRTDWHWPQLGNYYFTSGRSAHGQLSQGIAIPSYLADLIDDGYVTGNTSGYIGGSDGDCGRIRVEYLDASDNILATSDSNWVSGPDSVNWTQFANSILIPAGTRTVLYSLLTQRVNGTDCDAFFDNLAWDFSLAMPGNGCPTVPAPVQTPVSGGINKSAGFGFVSTDPQADQVSYQIDWGTDISSWSSLKNSGASYYAAHLWPIKGVYTVKARCRDINGAVSAWTSPYTITISGEAAGAFTSQPYLQNVSKTAMTIAWETDRYVYPMVNYGSTSSYGSSAVGQCINHNSMYTCKVRITGLSPETTYHFSALSGTTASADGTFTTAPNDDTPFTFAVWGDSQQIAKQQDGAPAYPVCSTAIFTDMASMTDMAVSVGDIVQYLTYDWYSSVFRPYACDILGKQKPFFVAFGNHDESETSIVHKAVENSGTSSFSFNYGNAHFTCVSYSDCVRGTLPSDGHINSLPLAWIEQDLASAEAQNATWRFLFIHVPIYCERWFPGSSIMQTYLVPLVEQYNVQICFSGHTHEYERGMLNGTFYVISGCASYLDVPEPIAYNWPHMTVGGAQNIPGLAWGGGLKHGWMQVDVNDTEVTLKQHGYNLTDGSYFGVIDTIHFALSDFNMDNDVNAKDMAQFADEWLSAGQYSKYDLVERSDKTVNMKDFAEFADYWFFAGEF